jgi:hypothetical protein
MGRKTDEMAELGTDQFRCLLQTEEINNKLTEAESVNDELTRQVQIVSRQALQALVKCLADCDSSF